MSSLLWVVYLRMLILLVMLVFAGNAYAASDCREDSLAESRLPPTWKSRQAHLKVGVNATKAFVVKARKYMNRYGGDPDQYHRGVVSVRTAEKLYASYRLCAAAYYLQLARTSVTYALQKADTHKPPPIFHMGAKDDGLFRLAYTHVLSDDEPTYHAAGAEIGRQSGFYDPESFWRLSKK